MYSIANISTMSHRIPKEVRSEMSPSHFMILDLIVSLMQSTSKRSPSKAFYAFPSQEWIAKRLDYTRSYMSECITAMASLGLIGITHRRKTSGHWQTNLYRIGIVLARALNMVSTWISLVSNRVGKNQHIVNKPYSKKVILWKDTLKVVKPPPSSSDIMTQIESIGKKLGFIK